MNLAATSRMIQQLKMRITMHNNSGVIYSLPRMRPIPSNEGCVEEELAFFDKPCLDDAEIRLAKKREIDKKAKFINFHTEEMEGEQHSKEKPNIPDRINCERLIQLRSKLKLEISKLEEQLLKTDAVLNLFGQNIDQHSKEFGEILLDYYYGEQKSSLNWEDYDNIIVTHAKLSQAS